MNTNPIQQAIEELIRQEQEYKQEIQKIENAIESLKSLLDFSPLKQPTTPRRKAPTKPPKRQAAKTTRQGAKNPFSKYKGVYKGKPRVDGTPTFRACIYVNGKNKTLGTYLIEEEAAAVAAKARGQMDLCRELMAIVEQKENNPDRPGSKPRKRRGKSHVGRPRKTKEADPPASMTADLETYYECEDCNAEYEYGEKPIACDGCGCEKFNEFQRPKGG